MYGECLEMCDGKAPNSSSTRVRTEISEWLVDVKDMMLKEAKRRQAAEVVEVAREKGVVIPEVLEAKIAEYIDPKINNFCTPASARVSSIL